MREEIERTAQACNNPLLVGAGFLTALVSVGEGVTVGNNPLLVGAGFLTSGQESENTRRA